MSELVAVTCAACGGAVAMQAGRSDPHCLFCGRQELRPARLPEGVLPPDLCVPFAVSPEQARTAFERFAKGSIWHPGDLRRAELTLEKAYVAAWCFSAEVETHWAAMIPASTRSGVRPVAGSERRRAASLIPASALLTRAELLALGAFDLSQATAFDPGRADAAHEIGTLTRSIAMADGRRALAAQIEAELGGPARKLSAAHVMTNLQGRAVLVPVWVGAYRWNERLFRVLVHGQTGRLVGKGPVSVPRVLAAIGVTAAALALGAALVGALAH